MNKPAKPLRLVFYEGKDFKWRWRIRAHNGRVIAGSDDGYATRAGAIQSAERLASYVPMLADAVAAAVSAATRKPARPVLLDTLPAPVLSP